MQDLPQPASPTALALTQYGEIDVLSHRQPRHIGLGNQRHTVMVSSLGDAQDSGCLLGAFSV